MEIQRRIEMDSEAQRIHNTRNQGREEGGLMQMLRDTEQNIN
jgi:hypothetical protein